MEIGTFWWNTWFFIKNNPEIKDNSADMQFRPPMNDLAK